MSLTGRDEGMTGRGAPAHAPQLAPSGADYALWVGRAHAHLQRHGSNDTHTTVVAKAKWLGLSAAVHSWALADTAAAEELAGGNFHIGATGGAEATAGNGTSKSAPSDTAAVKVERPSDAVLAARKTVTANVDRSRKIHSVLIGMMPADLQSQAQALPDGWVYGLWHWLETKFQSTAADSVDDLIRQWAATSQDEDESFDAYRARVDKLASLLKQAEEPQSARMYAFHLLERLQPMYRPAVMALKNSDRWTTDAKDLDWDVIIPFINAHERREARPAGDTGGDTYAAKAMAATSRAPHRKPSSDEGSSQSGSRSDQASAGSHRTGLKNVQCYNCQKFGHIGRNCNLKDKRINENKGGDKQEQVAAVTGGNPFAPLAEAESSSSESWGGECTFSVTLSPESERAMEAETERAMAASQVPARKPAALAKARAAPAPAAPAAAASPPPRSAARGSSPDARRAARPDASKMQPSGATVGCDTMASVHVFGDKDHFHGGLTKISPITVILADQSTVQVLYKGTVKRRVQCGDNVLAVTITDVHYHERFSTNLLSMDMLRRAEWEMHLTKEEVYVITPGGNKVPLSTKGRVSMLQPVVSERVLAATEGTFFALPAVDQAVGRKDLVMRLHAKLGHMSYTRMSKLLKSGKTQDLGATGLTLDTLQEERTVIQECEACLKGKGGRTHFGHRGVDHGCKPGEALHSTAGSPD